MNRLALLKLDAHGDQTVTPEAFVKKMIVHGVTMKEKGPNEMELLLRLLDPHDEGILFFGPLKRNLEGNARALQQRIREQRYLEVHGEGNDHRGPVEHGKMLYKGIKSGAWTQNWRQEKGAHRQRVDESQSMHPENDGGGGGEGGDERPPVTANHMKHIRKVRDMRSETKRTMQKKNLSWSERMHFWNERQDAPTASAKTKERRLFL